MATGTRCPPDTLPPAASPSAPTAENAESTENTELESVAWKPKADTQEDEQHERWLLSYADFITLLMVLFMMLYALQLVRNNDLASLTDKLQNEKPATSPVRPPVHPALQPSIQHTAILTRLQTLNRDGQIYVTERQRGVEIDLKSSLLFASGDAQVLPASRAALIKIAAVLRDYPDNDVMVEGHTDALNITTGKFASNWELSAARAAAVVRRLVDLGVSPARLVALGRANNVPAALGDTPEDMAKNRRVTIFVVVE